MSLFFKRPLFILGLPRSGTSLVAGMLKKMGFWCGSTVAGDGNNPKGYFEHSHIRETVIKKQLRDLGCDPLGVSKLPELESLPIDGGLRKTIFTLVKRDGYRDQRPWFYKDAKLSLLWPKTVHMQSRGPIGLWLLKLLVATALWVKPTHIALVGPCWFRPWIGGPVKLAFCRCAVPNITKRTEYKLRPTVRTGTTLSRETYLSIFI